jgi:tyrosine-protein kinase Etk/Wzc
MATETPLSEFTEREEVSTPTIRVSPTLKSDDELSLLDLLIILSERKRIILRITAAFALIAIVASLLLPNQYTATVLLLPPQQNSSLGGALTSQLSALSGLAGLAGGGGLLKNPNDMYVSMLKSRTVEDGIVQQFGLMQEYKVKYSSEARKAFEHHALVDGSGKDNLIHISIEDKDPKRAAEIANAYVEQYRKLSEHLAITEAAQRRLFFEQQLEGAKNNLANAEEALKKTQQTTGVIEINSQSRALIETAAVLRAQIAAKEVQIQAMETFATGQNAQLIQAQQELDSMKAQLTRLGGSAEDTIGAGFIVPKGKVPEAALEYLRKLRDVKYYETIFEILARQFEVAKLDEAKEGSIIQVVDSAVPPDRKSSPHRGLIVIFSTLLGLLLGITIAFFQAAWAGLKRHREANIKVNRIRQLLTNSRS